MEIDEHGLEVLSEEDCFRLLATAWLGRVGVTVGALPAILPVQFALLDRNPVFRSSPGAKLTTATADQVFCLEADGADPMFHEGWSVLVVGRGEVLEDPDDLERARRLPLRPWSPLHPDFFVRVTAEVVTGRRIGAALTPRDGRYHAGPSAHAAGSGVPSI